MKRNKGFTVVELVVVLAVLAVLIGLLVTQYIQYVEKSRTQICRDDRAELVHAYDVARGTGSPSSPELMEECLRLNGVVDPTAVGGADMGTVTCTGVCPSDKTAVYIFSITHGEVTQASCSHPGHGDIIGDGGSLGDKETMDRIIALMKGMHTQMDSAAAGTPYSNTTKLLAKLKAEGIDLDALGAKVWSYDNRGTLYFTPQALTREDIGKVTYVIRYNSESGSYTVWRTRVAAGKTTNRDENKKPVVYEGYPTIGGELRPYTPSTNDLEHQTYEDALKYYNRAISSQT